MALEVQLGTHQEGLVLCTRRDLVKLSGLDDFTVNLKLSLRSGQDQLFHRASRDQAQDPDLFLLTDTMRTIVCQLIRTTWSQANRHTDLELANPREGSSRYHSCSVSHGTHVIGRHNTACQPQTLT
jgi:hypothetical protein